MAYDYDKTKEEYVKVIKVVSDSEASNYSNLRTIKIKG